MKIWSIITCLLIIISTQTGLIFAEKTPSKETSDSQITIFFDVNGVLLLTDTFATLKMLRLGKLMRYALSKGIAPWNVSKAFKNRFFRFLDLIPLTDTEKLITPSFDEKGNKLPIIMAAYLNGLVTSQDIIARIEQNMLGKKDWFSSKTEARLILKLAKIIFTPQIFALIQKPNPRAISFLEKCKAAGIQMRILSNFDSESFAILQKKYPEIFNYFAPKDIILSGDKKLGKPDERLYQQVFEEYNPATTWFIDDQEANLVIPRKMGINCIHFATDRTYLGLYKKAAEFPDIHTFLQQPVTTKSFALAL